MRRSGVLGVLFTVLATRCQASHSDSTWSEDTLVESLAKVAQRTHVQTLDQHDGCVHNLRNSKWSCADEWTHERCSDSCQGAVFDILHERLALISAMEHLFPAVREKIGPHQRACTFAGVECHNDVLLERSGEPRVAKTGGPVKSIDWSALATVTTAYNTTTWVTSGNTTSASTTWHEETYEYQLNITRGDPARTLPWEQLAKLQHLRKVTLKEQNLGGSIEGLSLLVNLEKLIVPGNFLSGSIPYDLPTNLVTLTAARNSVSGTLPKTIRQLKTLVMPRNKLSGSIPWRAVSWYCTNSTSAETVVLNSGTDCGIEYLSLNHNQLSGELDVEIGAMLKLQQLRLNKNQLSGMIPWDALSRMPSLQTVDLSHNPFNNGRDGVGYDVSRSQCFYDVCFPKLGDLQVANCSLDRIPEAVLYMPKVWLINMVDNQLAGSIPPTLLRHPQLRWLMLSNNRLSEIPTAKDLKDAQAWIKRKLAVSQSAWGHSQAPTSTPTTRAPTGAPTEGTGEFTLTRNQGDTQCLDDSSFVDVQGYSCAAWDGFPCNSWPGYSEWEIAQVQINCPVTCFMCNDDSYPLQVLSLADNQLEGNLEFLTVYEHVKAVWLSQNKFSGTLPINIWKMTSLRQLVVGNNGISGTLPDELCKVSNLEILNLGSNKMTGGLPHGLLSHLPKLQHLAADNNQLSGTVTINSSAISTLELSHNVFNGQLQSPKCPKLEYLSLNMNRLKSVHSSIGNCVNLKTLQLLDNKMNSSLPNEFNSLVQLGTLFLAGNGMSCRLPMMENSPMLGEGEYNNPKIAVYVDAMNITLQLFNEMNCSKHCQSLKADLQDKFDDTIQYINSSATLLTNAVLVAPGNSFSPNQKAVNILTGRAEVSQLIKADLSMKGRSDYFPADSQFWVFTVYQVPVAVLFWALTLAAWTCSVRGCCCQGIWTCFDKKEDDNDANAFGLGHKKEDDDDCCEHKGCTVEARNKKAEEARGNEYSLTFCAQYSLLWKDWKEEKVFEIKLLRRLTIPSLIMALLGCGLLIPFYYYQEGFIDCPYLFTQLTSAYLTNDTFPEWLMCMYAFVPHLAASYFFYIASSFIIDSESKSLSSSHSAAFSVIRRYIKNPTSARAIRIWQQNVWGFVLDFPHKVKADDGALTQGNTTAMPFKSDPQSLESDVNDEAAPLGQSSSRRNSEYSEHAFMDGTELITAHSSLAAANTAEDPGIVCLSTTCCKSFWRSLFIRLCTYIGLAILSMPSFIFVLSSNVPHDGSAAYVSSKFFWDTMGNSGFLAVLTGIIDALLIPEYARFFVWAEGFYSGENLPLKANISKYKKELSVMIQMSFLLSVIMPLVWVLLLDHSCFRYYIVFHDELRSILQGWGEARTGADAYQRGHCTRRLIEVYGSVWAARLLMMAFLGPAIKYIKASSNVRNIVKAGISKINELRGKNKNEKDAVPSFLARNLEHIQEDVNVTYQMLGIMTVFGVHVPLLYGLGMCYVVTQTLCVSHVVQAQLCARQVSRITETIMIRYPIGPPFLYIIIAYLFSSWFVWDNRIPYSDIVYAWPGIVVLLTLWTIWSFGRSLSDDCINIFRAGTDILNHRN